MKKIVCMLLVSMLILSFPVTMEASDKMNVYSLDGRVEVINVSDFVAWHIVGWYSEPVMEVYSLDGRCEIIKKADFEAWHAVGWYSQPVMNIYSLDGRSEIVPKADLGMWQAIGWYSEPVMYVYAADGRKQIVTKREAPAWKAVGWDFQTDYADRIPFTNDEQYWAVIDLHYGPYRDWRRNINYYIDKYFIDMTEAERLMIKHYSVGNGDAYVYMVIPRFKTTNTATDMTLDQNAWNHVEGETLFTVQNGVPFTMSKIGPAGDLPAIFKVKNYCFGKQEFIVGQNLSDYPELTLDMKQVLDLTEYDGERGEDAVYNEKIKEYRNAMTMGRDAFDIAYRSDYETSNSSINSYMVFYTYIYDKYLYYTLYDIDGNGVEELIFSDFRNIIDIYTVHNGKLIKLFKDCSLGDRGRVHVLSTGQLFCEGSSGAASSSCELYRIDTATGKLSEPIASYYCDTEPSPYRTESTYVSGDTFYEIREYYTAQSIFDRFEWNLIN